MSKIKLGSRPKSFRYVVRALLLDGTEGTVEMLYRYRTRTEFGALVDALLAASKVPAPKVQTGEAGEEALSFSLRAALEATRDTNADYIMMIAEGWNLDEPFTLENVAQLCDEQPGLAMAIIEKYRAAITEGRLGN